VKILKRIASVGESGKNINQNKKKIRPYISRICPDAPLGSIGVCARLVEVINCAKFYRNRLKGFDSVRGRNLTITIGLRYRR